MLFAMHFWIIFLKEELYSAVDYYYIGIGVRFSLMVSIKKFLTVKYPCYQSSFEFYLLLLWMWKKTQNLLSGSFSILLYSCVCCNDSSENDIPHQLYVHCILFFNLKIMVNKGQSNQIIVSLSTLKYYCGKRGLHIF